MKFTVKLKYVFLNATIALLCFLFFLKIQSVTPFGSNNLLESDLDGQYINYFAYLKTIFAGENSIFYSFSKAIGGGLESLYAYYLLSPFNIIFSFFKIENFEIALTLLCTAKIVALASTAYIFFCELSEYKLKNCLFSLAFTFSAFSMVYLQNIMWMDGLILLPIVLLGVEKLINKNDSKLFIISLSCAIIFNFYIAFIICVFSALYIIFKLNFDNHTDKLRKFTDFCISGVLCTGISAVLILPTIKGISKSFKGISNATLFSFKPLMSIVDVLKQFVLPKPFEWSFIVDGPANIFCGIAIAGLFFCFFCQKNVSKTNKLIALAVTLVISLSFMFEGQMLLWHGGAYPIWFLYRNAFVFTFWAIYIAFEAMKNIKIKKMNTRLLVLVLGAVNMLSLAGYDIQVFKNIGYGSNHLKDFYLKLNPIIENIKQQETDKFYRIEKNFKRTVNDSMLLNYSGLSHYSTGDSEVTKEFAKKAGYKTNVQWIDYNKGSSLAIDSFLGLKYLISKSPIQDSLSLFATYKNITTYKNEYALPLGFQSDISINKISLHSLQPHNISNSLYSAVIGEQTIVDVEIENFDTTFNNISATYNDNTTQYALTGDSAYIEYKFIAPKTSDYYIYPQQLEGDIKIVKVSGSTSKSIYIHQLASENVFIGNLEMGEAITILLKPKTDFNMQKMHIFYTDLSALKQAGERIKTNGFEVTEFEQDEITGKIYIDENNKSLLLTIPYDKGWKVYIDGKKTSFTAAFDTFINVPITPGEHIVKLKYWPEYFGLGLVISIFSILFFIITSFKTSTDKKSKTRHCNFF